MTADMRKKKAALTRHPTPKTAVKAAQDAALAPPDDKEAQAKAAHVGQMGAARPAPFDKAAFVAAVNQAIAAQAPKNLDEADKFATSGKADAVKGQVAGQVTAGKQNSAKDIAEKTAAPPDPSKAVEKPVTPLPPPAATAAPAPPEQTDLSDGPRRTDAQMADAKLTPEQLAHSNEPQFTEALDAKRQADAHAVTAPARYRAAETARVAAEQGQAGAVGAAGVQEMAGAHAGATQKAAGGQGAAKSQEEQARAAVTAEIKTVFDTTKADTKRMLGALDGEVETAFDAGQKRAKDAFTADHQAAMARFKAERYSGFDGAARWLADLVMDLPPRANQIFEESKKVYEREMQKVVSHIADLIGKRLGEATQRIAKGRDDVAAASPASPRSCGSSPTRPRSATAATSTNSTPPSPRSPRAWSTTSPSATPRPAGNSTRRSSPSRPRTRAGPFCAAPYSPITTAAANDPALVPRRPWQPVRWWSQDTDRRQT